MNKYARFFAILKQINTNGMPLTKEQAVENFTNGATDSLSSLTAAQLSALERSLSAMLSPKSGNKTVTNKKNDKMRKSIISIFKSIGRTTDDAKAWAEKYGVYEVRRQFNDYDGQELWQLIRNAEKMKTDFINATKKSL